MNTDLNNVIYYFLIVDDDTDDHFFLRKAINKVIPQALVDSVYDGEEALEYLNRCTSMPNLIFLDLNMRKLSGRETMKIIKANETLCKVPVIILTTSKNEKEKAEMLSMGASQFYSKPAEASQLISIMEEVKRNWL
jgi:two-component system, response regulator